ncbi:hypothetical protein [Prevotella sp. tf2-5]|uniref:hypothetical protein n=1 Tax=Prevotella sp. tf2-5 TaxID=1761889 RepID=UPI0008EEA48E|nr:hypothetical protein [Prevotella sp. tf2-5]SFP02177.1 hypothetical protein SAMN04487852_11328 [Prevotella sp. tf2-5]
MQTVQQQYIANWHDSFVSYIRQYEALIVALIALPEVPDEDKQVLDRLKLMLHCKDAQNVEKDLAEGTVSKSTLDKIEKLNKDIADVAVEQLKTDAVVKEFLKRLTHLKLEQDKKAEELRLRALNISI